MSPFVTPATREQYLVLINVKESVTTIYNKIYILLHYQPQRASFKKDGLVQKGSMSHIDLQKKQRFFNLSSKYVFLTLTAGVSWMRDSWNT